MILQTSTKRFEKELLLMHKRGKDIKKLIKVTDLLVENIKAGIAHHLLLPPKYCLHKIINMENIWDCHIEPDWLLLYYLDDEVLRLERTGTHSDLFK
ncbi:MAG: type II toxin-antitoxin system YafQ family toxin [Rickettsia endosymbiont of Ecitomorpha arachnoides]|nr:type II toxin-antitoxin system YafQ family toxin [Rickettsia endosymbiont of Sceptobius lativentris]MCC8461862.1 type II toxin-antitoxin system YafQ family toxin [Rickettsia endosymbiont of Ecitomorpha arachnoides]